MDAWLRFGRRVLIINGAVFAGVIIVGVLAGWAWRDYSNALFIIGGGLVAVGVLRAQSLAAMDRNFTARFAGTTGSEGMAQAGKRMVRESESNFALTAQMFLIGLLPIIVSLAIPAVINR